MYRFKIDITLEYDNREVHLITAILYTNDQSSGLGALEIIKINALKKVKTSL